MDNRRDTSTEVTKFRRERDFFRRDVNN